MTSFKEELDDDIKELHEFISENLDMNTMFEQKILLQHYWKSLQRGHKKQLQEQQSENLELSGGDYIG